MPLAQAAAAVAPDMSEQYLCTPIAYLRSPYALRIDAPHQSTVVQGTQSGDAAQARVEFVEDLPAEAFADLEGFERIWLIFAFSRSQGWKAQVKPPRGGPKRGVLATRSPHRPNPLGLSAVELVAVEARALVVRGVDLLDGTPVLDIKPYVPYADAFAQSRAGWIDQIDSAQGRHSAPGPKRPRKPPPVEPQQ
ncbi:tRNA (N6-threonylcarbamoyladenosine(37)-N6)-methyltransferase TrmO [Pseudomonas sp. CGJS7]|uniref:tRNA (N6-threonylcarbamoyladenosine(37)-N6)-methyltransferase TrmO n=1 Tax=Pseudomonas sp. CGJS7 TaxID=3109348 RepID=UPI00300A3BEF